MLIHHPPRSRRMTVTSEKSQRRAQVFPFSCFSWRICLKCVFLFISDEAGNKAAAMWLLSAATSHTQRAAALTKPLHHLMLLQQDFLMKPWSFWSSRREVNESEPGSLHKLFPSTGPALEPSAPFLLMMLIISASLCGSSVISTAKSSFYMLLPRESSKVRIITLSITLFISSNQKESSDLTNEWHAYIFPHPARAGWIHHSTWRRMSISSRSMATTQQIQSACNK